MQATSIYTAVAILLCSVAVVYPLKCFVCSSIDDKTGCGPGKDVDRKYLIDCKDANKTLGGDSGVTEWKICRKIVTWVDFDVNDQTGGVERVLRRCGYDDTKYPDTCVYRGGLGGRQRVCSCKGDECNSAPKTTMTLTAYLGVLVPVFIYFKFQ